MVNYDPSVIRRHATLLYIRSGLVIVFFFMFALLVSIPAFFISNPFFVRLGFYTPTDDARVIGSAFLLHGAFYAVGGLIWGIIKSFHYRLEAQIALCQVAIEENTRHLRR